jgi:hypothetical protein
MVEDTRCNYIDPHVLLPYLGPISGLRVNRDLCQIILLIPGHMAGRKYARVSKIRTTRMQYMSRVT